MFESSILKMAEMFADQAEAIRLLDEGVRYWAYTEAGDFNIERMIGDEFRALNRNSSNPSGDKAFLTSEYLETLLKRAAEVRATKYYTPSKEAIARIKRQMELENSVSQDDIAQHPFKDCYGKTHTRRLNRRFVGNGSDADFDENDPDQGSFV